MIPQMGPLSWVSVFFFVLFTIILVFTFLYFFKENSYLCKSKIFFLKESKWDW